MPAIFSSRADAIFRALLPDAHEHERDELRASRVSRKRIATLYAYDLARLTDGLHAYMVAGGRITMHHPLALHRSVADRALPLHALLTYVKSRVFNASFDDRWELIAATAQDIADHPATTFHKVEGNTTFNGPHKQQGVALIARLSAGLLYVQQLLDTPEAGAYLESLVDTYLPDLLGKQ